MLFAMTYTIHAESEKKDKRSLKLFTNWQPPAGFVFKSHYSFADGTGGMGVVDVSAGAAMLEAVAPWGPFFKFHFVPIVEVEKAVPLFQKVTEWRDSIE